METTLKIDGMTCGMCVRHVTEAIQSVSGVADVHVDLASGTAQFKPNGASIQEIVDAIQEEGYEAREV